MPVPDHIFALRQEFNKLKEAHEELKLAHIKLKADIASGLDLIIQNVGAVMKKERRKR